MGSFGATDVTKYLKLGKINNFLRQRSDATQKNVIFAKLSLVANNFGVITNVEGVGVLFFHLESILEKHLERETFTQK